MHLVPALGKRAEQPLQIQLGSAGRGELSADKREFHQGVIFLVRLWQSKPIQEVSCGQSKLLIWSAYV